MNVCRLALLGAALLLPPLTASATSVGDVVRAHAAMHRLDDLSEADLQAYRASHRDELLRAARVLDLASMAFETVVDTSNAAFDLYGIRLLCNFDDETRAGDDELIEEFIADGIRRFGLGEAETRRRLYQTDWEDMLAPTLMRHYACPGAHK